MLRRNRNFMGGFAGRRDAPVMHMPGNDTSGNASFDPLHNNTSGAPTKNYFGLGNSHSNRTNVELNNNSSNTMTTNHSSSIQYKRFDTSSDDDDDKDDVRESKAHKGARNNPITHVSKRARHA